MCGICGFITDHKINIDNLKQMNNTMIHRGPDDSGEEIHQSGNKYIGLAQRRLSIIDLSPLGHQPMFSADNKVAIVFNGEIYNFKDLRKELEGYNFISTSDTEVIIAAYLKWGLDFLNNLNGMFAIAIYDFRDEKLILARDRVGKKPLYYYMGNGNFVFSSELKPIMKYPYFKKNIKRDIISKYLYHGYINAPETIFEDTYKMEPGQLLIYKSGKIEKIKFWNAVDKYLENRANPIEDYKQAKFELSNLIEDSVRKRMVADVPLGTFLSGGIDSTIVTSIAQKYSKKPMKTFSIGFMDKELDEAIYSKEVAEYLGTEHTEFYIEESKMKSLVDSIPDYYDEPMADSSQIPTMLVSELAKNEVTVALNGDGGDELFCGYGRYASANKAKKYEPIGMILHSLLNLPLMKQLNIIGQLPNGVQSVIKNRDEGLKSQVGGIHNISICNDMVNSKQNEIKYPIEQMFDTNNWMQRLMLVDLLTVLPEDLLQKVDRATMKYSLEGRSPLLDYRIIEYSFRIPHEFKYKNNEGKYILKDILYDYVPKQMMDRPKKGFSVPLQKWLKNDLIKKLKYYSESKKLIRQGIFNHLLINKMITELENTNDHQKYRYTKYLWGYYVFQMWYEKYIEEL